LSGRPWSVEEDIQLAKLVPAGHPFEEISARLPGRSPSACINRSDELGLKHPRRTRGERESLKRGDIDLNKLRPVSTGYTPSNCQYIAGEPTFYKDGELVNPFCGKPCIEGRPYCKEHTALCYIPGSGDPKYARKQSRHLHAIGALPADAPSDSDGQSRPRPASRVA